MGVHECYSIGGERMIGPRAYEELFQTKAVAATHEGYVILCGDKEYTYQLHMPELWNSISEWMDW